MGDKTVAPAATDPNVGYPPADWWWVDDHVVLPLLDPVILYPVHDARVESARIHLTVNPNEEYAGWCALQTSTYRVDQVEPSSSTARWVNLGPSWSGRGHRRADAPHRQADASIAPVDPPRRDEPVYFATSRGSQ